MQVKNRWENAKLIMLNNKASIENGSWFFIPSNSISEIKQKFFLLGFICMCRRLLLLLQIIDMEFSRTFYKYSMQYLSQTMTTVNKASAPNMPKGPLFPCYATALLNFINTVPTRST
jgi:hypothetical protein